MNPQLRKIQNIQKLLQFSYGGSIPEDPSPPRLRRTDRFDQRSTSSAVRALSFTSDMDVADLPLQQVFFEESSRTLVAHWHLPEREAFRQQILEYLIRLNYDATYIVRFFNIADLTQAVVDVFSIPMHEDEPPTRSYSDFEDLMAFDATMHGEQEVSEYLKADESNVVIAYENKGRYACVQKSIDTVVTGNLKDYPNSAYFVRCTSDDTEQLASSVDSTYFDTWYYKVFGESYNVLIPLRDLFHFISYMTADPKTRIIVAYESEMHAASDVRTTQFAEGLNVFGEQINAVSATHCNTTESFMKKLAICV